MQPAPESQCRDITSNTSRSTCYDDKLFIQYIIGIYSTSIYIYGCVRARYDSPSYRPGYHSQVSEPGAGAGARAGREVAGSREGYHSLDNRGYRHRDYRCTLPVDQ